nr:MAG TPA: hypothetical protein [Herelleviridae sp.]
MKNYLLLYAVSLFFIQHIIKFVLIHVDLCYLYE